GHLRLRRLPGLDEAGGRACRQGEVERGRRGGGRWRRRGRGGIERYRESGLRRRFARAVVDAVPVGRGEEDPLVRIPVCPSLDDRRQVEGHLAEGRRIERILARPRRWLARRGEAIPS